MSSETNQYWTWTEPATNQYWTSLEPAFVTAYQRILKKSKINYRSAIYSFDNKSIFIDLKKIKNMKVQNRIGNENVKDIAKLFMSVFDINVNGRLCKYTTLPKVKPWVKTEYRLVRKILVWAEQTHRSTYPYTNHKRSYVSFKPFFLQIGIWHPLVQRVAYT